MTYPNPPDGEPSPFDKPAAEPTYGQPQYGQPAYGQQYSGQPGPTAEYGAPQFQPTPYLQVPPGYYPVFNAQNQQVLVPLASPGKRFGTYLLEIVLTFVTLFIGYLIWTLFTWGKGQTPGKTITKLKYVDVSTGRVSDWGKSAFRDFVIRGILVGIISAFTLYIGFLVMAFMIFNQQKNYQAGWDRIAGTVVVDVSNVDLG